MANECQAMSALTAALEKAGGDVGEAVRSLQERGVAAEVVQEAGDGEPCRVRINGVYCIPRGRLKNRSS